MEISVNKVYKRYNAGWVIRDLNLDIEANEKIGLSGPNGSGKSTLLQIISGILPFSDGKILYSYKGQNIQKDNIYKYLALAAAYAELDEELSVREIFHHFRKFKPFHLTDLDQFVEFSGFTNEREKVISMMSSGMKQRLMLSLALNTNLPLLLLDEPGSYLDLAHKSWFVDKFRSFTKEKTVIIASNDADDLNLCNRIITIDNDRII